MADAAYNSALVTVGAVLALKLITLHFMTVRSRVVYDDFSRVAALGKTWDEDKPGVSAGWVGTLLYYAMGGMIKISPPVERLVGVISNANENEPYFLGLAVIIAVGGTPPSWGVTALYIFMGARLVHALICLTPFPETIMPYKQIMRASCWLIGAFDMAALALNALL